jgi:hypothetical protein
MMRNWAHEKDEQNILYKKIRQNGLTLGPVAVGEDGGPYNWLSFIQLRFRKGIEKLYDDNQLYVATYHRTKGKKPFIISIK